MCRRTLQCLIVLTLLATILVGSRLAAAWHASRTDESAAESTFSLKVNVDLVVLNLAVIDEYETVFESFGWKAGLVLPRAIGEALSPTCHLPVIAVR